MWAKNAWVKRFGRPSHREAELLWRSALGRKSGALFGLDLGVHLALGAVGPKNGAHHEPEDKAEQNCRGNREDYVPADVVNHVVTIRLWVCALPVLHEADDTLND